MTGPLPWPELVNLEANHSMTTKDAAQLPAHTNPYVLTWYLVATSVS